MERLARCIDCCKTRNSNPLAQKGIQAVLENVCQTLLEFQLHVNVDIAATDVREKLDLIRSEFPQDVEGPKILKFDINAKPIIALALTGDAPIDALYDYVHF